MSKVVLMMSISLDGYFEGPDASLEWHLVDEELHRHFNDVLAPMAGFLEGRVMHERMAEFWPTADSNPASTEAVVEYSGIWKRMPKVVYSRTLTEAGWNTTIVHEVVVEEVEALKAAADGDLALGGADLAATFMRLGLIDEYRIYLHPVVVGAGRPLFPRDVRLDLELTQTHRFTNGVVLLRYVPR